MREFAVKTHDVSKIYGDKNNKVHALTDINIEIKKSALVTISGKSGSRKTTLLNLLGGLDSQSKGDIYIDNCELSKMSEKEMSIFRRKKIGFVFQFFNLIPELNAQENILFPAGIDKTEIDRKYFDKVAALLDIEDRLYHLPGELSGGQQQRVSIARALIMKPEILLMDEPIGNLDTQSGNSLIHGIIELKNQFHQTILIVTHDADIVRLVNDNIELVDGKVV